MYVDNLRNLPFTASSILRKLENVKRKIIKCKWSIVFNKTCLNENILPNYTNVCRFQNNFNILNFIQIMRFVCTSSNFGTLVLFVF